MFTIYKLTAPSGRFYVGVTSQSVAERWRQHCNRAKSGHHHPLCCAIRKYGADAFHVEALASAPVEAEALRLEREHIASTGAQIRGYNLSDGGEYDWRKGVERLKELREDPVYDAEYRRKLSEGCRNSLAHGPNSESARAWARANPREAYLVSYRNMRIARRAIGIPRHQVLDHRFARNGRLAIKSDKVAAARRAFKAAERVAGVWARRDSSVKTEICQRISDSHLARNAQRSVDVVAQDNARLADARKSIDHTHRIARLRASADAKWQKKIAGLPPETIAKMEKVRERHRAKASAYYYKRKVVA